ncbi:ABC transporter ATP-binding protein [Desertimonas flava]|uniref:ABC transporter ATP-binding protein n=1 Tax=Desertimonas flava TaxID=2064846 RepID=UPI000E355C7A|nr:ABC transporter ATP-binding protein [Desertimonas flava]
MNPALVVDGLVVRYGTGRDSVTAVDGVDLRVEAGSTLGIIGESGSGKSTLALAIAGLIPTAAGRVLIGGGERAPEPAPSTAGRDGRVQMIFQDPMLAMNPRMPIWKIVAEPLAGRRRRVTADLRERACALLADVGIGGEFADRRPAQLSGGQRQRVTIARAVAAGTPLIMCDEPVAALDVSLQAGVLRLLADLQREHGHTYVFISHDMSSISRLADRVGVMYLGSLVEVGDTRTVLAEPQHPYTKLLIDSIPRVGRTRAGEQRLLAAGEIPDARNPPSGCRFRTRCVHAQQRCAEETPELRPGGAADHSVACHFADELAGTPVPVLVTATHKESP